jgi:hypothetical protein
MRGKQFDAQVYIPRENRLYGRYNPKDTSPFNMCMAVAVPRLYAVVTKNSLNVSEAKMRVIFDVLATRPAIPMLKGLPQRYLLTFPISAFGVCSGGLLVYTP